MASVGTEHKSGSFAKRGLLLLAVVLMFVCLAWAGIALAAPRSSGSSITTTDESASAESSSTGGLYTRSDIPRPSGDYSSWFAVEEEEPAATTTTKLPEVQTTTTTATDSASATEEADDDWWSSDMDCSTCHDIDALADETADSTVLTDINGTVVNPHDLPDISNHSSITCANCHRTHDDSTIEKWSMRTCESCHHADVWECYTCHS